MGTNGLTPHKSGPTIGVATFNGELTLTLTGHVPSKSLLAKIEKILIEVCDAALDIPVGNAM